MEESKAKVCPRCGWDKVRPSFRTSIDWVFRLVLLAPFRCRRCRHRFYGFALHAANPVSAE